MRTKGFSGWPIWDKEHDEERVVSVLRSGVWSRSKVVAEFEKKYAELLGAKRCLATTHGTTALLTALNALDIGVGDEVLVGPYTFVASVAVIFLSGALPIMVDTDRETFLVNPEKMEAKITPNTKAILPVHIYGLPADMDRINAIAKKHNLLVLEDACQAWLAEMNGKKCGTLGNLGCFSFQNSKHLTCGEGGAVVGDDEALMKRAFSYHNFGSGGPNLGSKCRMTEFQAAILLAQMQRLEEQSQRRWENAVYLTSKLRRDSRHHAAPAVRGRDAGRLSSVSVPVQRAGVQRRDAGQVHGRVAGGGHPVLRRLRPFERGVLYRKHVEFAQFPADVLRGATRPLPRAARMSRQQSAVQRGRLLQPEVLLGTKEDMDDIANAIGKIYENREQLA